MPTIDIIIMGVLLWVLTGLMNVDLLKGPDLKGNRPSKKEYAIYFLLGPILFAIITFNLIIISNYLKGDTE